MIKAIWNGEVIAESNKTIIVEGNHYFPPEDIRKDLLVESDHHTRCPWKGEASYYNIRVEGKTNEIAAWYYSAPSVAANHIKDYVAFWRGVEIAS